MEQPIFEQIVSLYYEPLYRFALSLAKSEDDAFDMTQETFYRWAAKGNQLRDQSKIKSWLFTTLYRNHLGKRRHETRFRHYEIDSLEEHELQSPPLSVPDKMDAGALMKALHQLEENFRAPLVLFYLEELSYREIAELLELPIGTVMSRLARGKEMLRRTLHQPESDSIVVLKPNQQKAAYE